MRLTGFRRRLARSVGRARVLINIADHFHLSALDARLLQILDCILGISIAIQNSDDYKFHMLAPLNPWRPRFRRARMIPFAKGNYFVVTASDFENNHGNNSGWSYALSHTACRIPGNSV